MTTKKTAKKAVKKPAAKTAKKPDYAATLIVAGKRYTATGASVAAAIDALKPERGARGKAILAVSRDGVTREKVLPPFAVARLFTLSPTMRELQLRNLTTLFAL